MCLPLKHPMRTGEKKKERKKKKEKRKRKKREKKNSVLGSSQQQLTVENVTQVISSEDYASNFGALCSLTYKQSVGYRPRQNTEMYATARHGMLPGRYPFSPSVMQRDLQVQCGESRTVENVRRARGKRRRQQGRCWR